MSIDISIIVPTYNRPHLLARCLSALLAQDFNPSAFEILVIDDAADIHTRKVVEQYAQKAEAYSFLPRKAYSRVEEPLPGGVEPPTLAQHIEGQLVRVPGVPRIRYLPVTGNHGPAIARNLGIQMATGAILAFTDDDCIPTPSWLRSGFEAFQGGVAGVSGQVIVPLSENPTDYERDASGLERSEFVTANCFYRKAAVMAVGGFDQRFTSAWREDSDLYFKLVEAEYPLVHAQNAFVIHPIRPAPWGISIRQQKKNKFNALLFKKHPWLYRKKIQHRPPLRYYAILLASLGGITGFVLNAPILSLVGGTVWLALTTAFWLFRLKGNSKRPKHILEMLITSFLIPPVAVFWRLRGALEFKVIFI